MPATIAVVRGTEKGQTFEVESRVITIGGHPGCEIHISGQPDAVATVRFRGGVYTVFNRGEDSLDLGGEAVPREGAGKWSPGVELVLPRGVVLKLEISGSPEPIKRVESHDAVDELLDSLDEDDEADGDASEPKKPARQSEMAVIAVCILACVWLIAPEEKSQQSLRNPRKEIHDLVVALLRPELRELETPDEMPVSAAKESPGASDEPSLISLVNLSSEEELALFDVLRESLQRARIAELRGDRQGAVSAYLASRDLLASMRGRGRTDQAAEGGTGNAAGAAKTIYGAAYDFVAYRLDSLGY